MKRVDLRLDYEKETGKEYHVSAIPTADYCRWLEDKLVKLFAMPVVSGAKRKVCPVCWQPLEDGIVKNMCVNDDCPTNGGQTYR